MPHRPALHPSLRIGTFALVAACVVGCNKPEPAQEPAREKPAALATAELPPAPTPAQPAPPPSAAEAAQQPAPEEKLFFQGPDWKELKLQDSLPLCVFASGIERDKAPFIEQVKRQTLAANSTVVFGVFPPWCLNDACDALPTLQCWVERDGDTLTVNTRFFSFHKTGAKCKTDCLEVDTACETPELAPGAYKVRHGAKTYKLQIPSAPRSACFNAR